MIFGRQGIQGFMHGQDFGGGCPVFDSRFVKFFHSLIASAFLARLAPRLVDQDLPHGLGRGAKEMAAVIPLLLPGSGQLKPGLMDKRGGLERLAGICLGHFASCQPAQFVIHQRQQFVGGFRIAAFDGGQVARYVLYERKLREEAPKWKREK
jgi:hypothetical protein